MAWDGERNQFEQPLSPRATTRICAIRGSAGFSVLSDMGFDTLREFWPEIAHKFKLPFRFFSEPEPMTDTSI